jgi:hypothetical protein
MNDKFQPAARHKLPVHFCPPAAFAVQIVPPMLRAIPLSTLQI